MPRWMAKSIPRPMKSTAKQIDTTESRPTDAVAKAEVHISIEDGLYAHNLMGSFQSGINHGSVQIMRDQMARRGLGLPRG